MKKLILNQIPTDAKGNPIVLTFGSQAQNNLRNVILLNFGGRVITSLRNSSFPDDVTGEKVLAAEAFAQRIEAHIEAGNIEMNTLLASVITEYDAKVAQIIENFKDVPNPQAKQKALAAASKELLMAQIAKQPEMTSRFECQSDAEYDFICGVYQSEKVLIRVPFLNMIAACNPVSE